MKKMTLIFLFLSSVNAFANCYYNFSGSISSCESIPTRTYVVVDCLYGPGSKVLMGGCMDSTAYPPASWNLYICAGHGVPLSKTCPTVPPAKAYTPRSPSNTQKSCGSIIHIESQTLTESIPLVGINYSLNYSSQRVKGRKSWYEIDIPITASGFSNNGHYLGTKLTTTIAGQVSTLNFSYPASGVFYNYVWDGKDNLGNIVTGTKPLKINITGDYDNITIEEYVFPVYDVLSKKSNVSHYKSATSVPAFVFSESEDEVFLGTIFSEVKMGGWSFSVHHRYDNVRNVLYLGDGTEYETGSKLDSSGNHYVVSKDRNEIYYFDSSFKHVSTKSALTGITQLTFSYNINNDLISISDAYGKSITIQYSGTDVISITSPYGEVTLIETDLNGYISSVTNPASEVHEMSYSSDGLLLSFEKPNGVVSTMLYDSKGLLVSDLSTAGNEVLLSRTQTDNSVTITETSAMGVVKTHKIDNAAVYNRRTTYPNSYYDNYSINTGGQETVSNSSSYGTYKTYKNDTRFGVPFKRTDFSRRSDGYANPSTYLNEVFSLSDPTDPFSYSTLSTTFTTGSRVEKVDYTKSTKEIKFSSPLNRTVTMYLNNQGDVISEKVAGQSTVNFSYDSEGKIEQVTQGSRSTDFTYNSLGRIETIENSMGQVSSYTYDLAGRVSTITLPDLRVVNLGYDSNGNLSSVTPAGKSAHSMVYNGFDLLSSYLPPTISAPSSTSTAYYYDDDRRLLQILRPGGQAIQYAYHSTNGNLVTTTLPSGVRTYSYVNGQLSSSISEDLYSSSFTYKGSLPGSSSVSKGTFSYSITDSYNSENILPSSEALSIKTYSGTINYSYDNDDLLLSAGDETFTRDLASGLLTKISMGSISKNYSYTMSTYGELSLINAKYLTTDIYNEALTRDNSGRIIETNKQYGAGTPVQTEFIYDSAGRLTDVEIGGILASHYEYDSNSNRISQTKGSVTTSATYDDQDRLLTFGTKSFVYTLNGDLSEVTDSATAQTSQYLYDVIGNLKSVTLPSKTVNYEVDFQNRRMVKKNGTTVENYFVWNTWGQLIGVTDSSGALVSRFVYGSKAHVPDYAIIGSDKYQIITDHLGSPVVVVNTATGVVAQEVKYDEFGNITSDTNPGFTPFGFAGCLYDQDTKLCRFGARDYDASIGRWLSKDPILFAGGDTNLYGYVMQDPINLIDPSGLAPGDNFGSESAAGYDAINYINNASIFLNREFAGTIYRNAQGGYSYTNPLMGGAAGANPGSISANTTAIYHTHAGFDPRYDNENFSGADTRFSTSRGLGSYLGTPFGSTQYQGPRGNKTYMSGPNSCGR